MEIEAKFAILDEATYQALAALKRLDGMMVSEAYEVELRDTYLDTPDGRLLRAGYACRHRLEGDMTRLTVKSLTPSTGSIHRREEIELIVDHPIAHAPQSWPEGRLRDLVLGIVKDEPVGALVTLTQERKAMSVRNAQGITIAEMALDRVEMQSETTAQRSRELEIELTRGGTEDELEAVIAYLARLPGLVPEPRSKFERAMALGRPRSAGGNAGSAREEA